MLYGWYEETILVGFGLCCVGLVDAYEVYLLLLLALYLLSLLAKWLKCAIS